MASALPTSTATTMKAMSVASTTREFPLGRCRNRAAGYRLSVTDNLRTQREPVSRPTARRRERRTAWLVGALVVVVVALGLLWLLPFGIF
jgi:hypothetical protein